MALAVNGNSAAFATFADYSQNIDKLKTSMSKLSTGVVSVVDDPSGVGISERMRAQVRGASMSRHNVDNGLSLLQTADAWLQKVSDMLGRMHELSVEATDGTKTKGDIAQNVQAEFKELQSEITRITSRSVAAAKFNGLFLFRGGNGRSVVDGDQIESGSVTIQIGPDIDQKLGLSLANLSVQNTETIGTVSTYLYSTNNSVSGSTHTQVTWASVIDTHKMSVTSAESVGKLSLAVDHVAVARATLGAQQSRLSYTRDGLLAYEDNLRSAESKIRDVDVAQASTNLAKYQVLTQIGTAMLAQAQQLPASAVQLLG